MNLKALCALFGTVLLWSLMTVISRFAIASISGAALLFLRMLIASIAFLPIFLHVKPWKKPHFKQLVIISTFSGLNISFFILGIQYTSASASQIIYAAMPILVLMVNTIFLKKKYNAQKYIGICIGFFGLLYIMYLSSIGGGTTISGSLHGNLLIIFAMFCWTAYLLLSKKISKYFTPLEIGSTSVLWGFVIATVIFIFLSYGKMVPIPLTWTVIVSALYIGLCGTFLTYILYQYAIKHLSALTISLSSYVQPITTTFLAILLIGEQLTVNYIIGSIVILFGVLLSSDFKILFNSKR
jgi:drug/metabolite transporter (DMT)-like permease